MAEGGNSQALKDGSDADFELECTPCGKDNIREEADKYCPECQEYLCRTCIRYHGRLKGTQEHKLLDKNDAQHGLLVTKTKCRYHSDRDIEMYCNTHDMVYCLMCIATDHRSCTGVDRIEDVSKKHASQADVQTLLSESEKAEDKVVSLTFKQKQNLTALDEQRKSIQIELDATEARLIEHIKTLKIKTTERLNDEYSTLKKSLLSSIGESSSTVEALKQTQVQLNSINNLDTDQQFVKMNLMNKTFKDANKFIRERETNVTISIEFIENRELTNFIVTADFLGDVICGNKSGQKPKDGQQYKVKMKKEINVKLPVDKSTCLISEVTKLPSGTFLLTDFDNRKVKRLDSNDCVMDFYD